MTPTPQSEPSERMEIRAQIAFAMVPEWLIDSDVTDAAIRLYAVLHRLADGKTRMVKRNRKAIARRLGKSVSTVDRLMRELTMAGAVVIYKRYKDGRQPGKQEYLASEYLVVFTPPRGRTDAATPSEVRAGQTVIPTVSTRTDAATPPPETSDDQREQGDLAALVPPPGPTDAATPGRTDEASSTREPEDPREPLGREEPSAAPQRVTLYRAAYNALARAAGRDPESLSPKVGKEIGVALGEIRTTLGRENGVDDPAKVPWTAVEREIPVRMQRLRKLNPHWTPTQFTPSSLAKWWDALAVEPAAPLPRPGPGRGSSAADVLARRRDREGVGS